MKKTDHKAFTPANVFSPQYFWLYKAGFTLAEVLITLSIIGVVAAITLPTLITNVQEKTTVSKVKKFYNTVENAYQRMIQDYGTIDTWGLMGAGDSDYYLKDENGNFILDENGKKQKSEAAKNSSNLVLSRLLSYMKVISLCQDDSCAQTVNEYYLDGTLKTQNKFYPAVLADGIGISGIFIATDGKCSLKWGKSKLLQNGCGDMYIMLKPKMPSHTYGKDFFRFAITKYGILPSGTPQETGNDGNMKNCLSKKSWSDCTGWVIYKENMDYLHCDNLSWDGPYKCK